MDKYLTIITTVLVATQIIRLVQNTISLRRQAKMMRERLDGLEEITGEDLKDHRLAYKLAIQYFKERLQEVDNG